MISLTTLKWPTVGITGLALAQGVVDAVPNIAAAIPPITADKAIELVVITACTAYLNRSTPDRKETAKGFEDIRSAHSSVLGELKDIKKETGKINYWMGTVDTKLDNAAIERRDIKARVTALEDKPKRVA